MNSKISTYLIGIVIFTLVIAGGVSMIGILGDTNGDIVNNAKYGEFNRTANKIKDVQDSMGDIEASISEAPVDPGTLGVLSSLINTAWQMLKSIPALFGFMTTTYFDLCAFFGIPAWIPGIMTFIVSIILVFVLYGAFLQHDI